MTFSFRGRGGERSREEVNFKDMEGRGRWEKRIRLGRGFDHEGVFI